ncbi:MarR family winged helix-turn-helix transcriptional regulator [Branchiibius cervicis]|uniref:MarR family winged helix-turn-helix transcriptional regulator n=1 Tax=Branchiibius cervicis TaxID=908252 RepID=A0ABW2AQ89_9MICO
MNTKLPFDPIERARELWRERWGDDAPYDAMATATSIMRVQQRLLADLDAAVAPYGLTFARYEALVLLAFSREGRLPMSKVGERLMIHPTSATNIVQRLAADGLVERVPNPRDGRGTLACLTPEGNAAWSKRRRRCTRLTSVSRVSLSGSAGSSGASFAGCASAPETSDQLYEWVITRAS